MIKILRLYQSEKGIWRYEIERDGKVCWSSLHTRDEQIARATYERIKAMINAARDEARREMRGG